MKLACKFVVLVLALVIGVVPSFAAIACAPHSKSAVHCSRCCHAMNHGSMAGMQSDMQQPQQALTVPSCCQISSDDPVLPTNVWESQTTTVKLLSSAEVSSVVTFEELSRPGRYVFKPDRSAPPDFQSQLCTFRI